MVLESVRMSKKDYKRKDRDGQRSGKVLWNTFSFPYSVCLISLTKYIVHKQLFSENSLPVVTHIVVMFHCCSYNALLSGHISLSDSHVREGGGSVTSIISSSR